MVTLKTFYPIYTKWKIWSSLKRLLIWRNYLSLFLTFTKDLYGQHLVYIIYVLIIFRQTSLFNNFAQYIIIFGNWENPIKGPNNKDISLRYWRLKIIIKIWRGWNIGNIQQQYWCYGEIIFSFCSLINFLGQRKYIFYFLSIKFVCDCWAGSGSSVVPFPIQYLLNIPRCNWFLSVSQERLKSSGNMVWRIQSQTRRNRIPNKGKSSEPNPL